MGLSYAGDLTVQTVAERLPELLAELPEDGELELDLSAIDEVDTAGLQLLLVIKREATARGCPLRLTAVGDSLARLLALTRLDMRLDPARDTAEGETA
ncbi:STAS domain-containing protein [Mangrovihabitans endophyticus]|uniref:STAS domain-containing protein n=1 Tax=Mangrovihabitans endophyticus TaxID=1751298 RepID=A0A8J3C4I8_9ACTN|nr:STAS domain-containing protein [Mangrovihabitans endophyticus]GGL07483.1 hypothetical protein GCM10012284_47250 [Mangrovihabitans endophyticus]